MIIALSQMRDPHVSSEVAALPEVAPAEVAVELLRLLHLWRTSSSSSSSTSGRIIIYNININICIWKRLLDAEDGAPEEGALGVRVCSEECHDM